MMNSLAAVEHTCIPSDWLSILALIQPTKLGAR
jgi:hypothetical protein